MASAHPAEGRDNDEELEKYKRRIIRTVARKLSERKPEDVMWDELKKEIGINCKALWERMRGLTIKKLKKMLDADDRLDRISPVSRMTVTDWLLYDLVITHQKVDVINTEELELSGGSRVLGNLFSLVQRFGLEARAGDSLAQAWASATLYYNSKGHRCSAMLMQRRWYQLKELTRDKFYKFWYRYRGNQRSLPTAKQDSPDELQKAIALKYPQLITSKFLTWEERIQKRLVILPHELSVKMKQGEHMTASDTSAPDLVLVEPKVDVVDLRSTSVSEEEVEELTNESQVQQTVKIKSEPVDNDEDMEQYQQPEKRNVVDEAIDRLQMTEEYVDEDSVDSNVKDAVVIDPTPINDYCIVASDEEITGDEEIIVDDKCLIPENVANFPTEENEVRETEDVISKPDEPSRNDLDAIVIDDDNEEVESSVQNENISVRNPKEMEEEQNVNNNEVITAELDPTEEAEETNVVPERSADASIGVHVDNVEDDAIKTSNNLDQSVQGTNSSDCSELMPVISTISSAGVKVETDLAVSHVFDNSTVTSDAVDDHGSADKDEFRVSLPLISTVSSQGVKIEIQSERISDQQVDSTPTEENSFEDNVICKEEELAEIQVEDFSDQAIDSNFADDGIDFADDGIAYVEDEEDDIIRVLDTFPHPIKNESDGKVEESQKQSQHAGDKDRNQKFDLKLLMCPVVYTTKLEVMSVFSDNLQYEHVDGKANIDKIYTLSKPISAESITSCDMANEPEIDSNLDALENKDTVYNYSNSDDDLFKDDAGLYTDDTEDFIDDSQRVKMASFMLRKPRNRTYNPVILCKNPDFNTRLKKLSVGFFMSTRNRNLLQACTPMTVDLSKTFESKLINGTLYLKDVPKTPIAKIDTVIEINDDVEMTPSNLIQPTAVQQSFDLNIEETLQNELKKRMAERARAINLPDISQVRQLNQHLLTAEVTPLRVESQNTNPDPSKFVQSVKNDIDNLISQQVEKEKSLNISVEVPISRHQGKTQTPSMLQGNHSQIWTHNNLPKSVAPKPLEVTSNDTEQSSRPLPPNANNHIDQMNTTEVIDRPLTNLNNATRNNAVPKIRKPARRTYYPTPAWNKPRPYTAQEMSYHSDALLTLDTLYKMLSALDPCSNIDLRVPKKQNKQKKKENKQDLRTKTEAKKDEIIDITEDEVKVPEKQEKKKLKRRLKVNGKLFCCFKRYELEVALGYIEKIKRRHGCIKECTCCCRFIFVDDIKKAVASIEEPTSSDAAASNIAEKPCVDQVDLIPSDEQTTDNVILDITVDESNADCAQMSEHNTPANIVGPGKGAPIPKVRIYSALPTRTIHSINTEMSKSPEQPVPVHQSGIAYNAYVPLTENNNEINEVIIDTDMETNMDSSSLQNESPQKDVTELNEDNNIDISQGINETESDKVYTLQENKIVTNKKKIDKPTLNTTKIAPTRKTFKRSRQIIMKAQCSCRPNISKVKHGKLEIDGAQNCDLHKNKQVELKLNKRHTTFSDGKAILSKRLVYGQNKPFFVGKNKILLTNFKMTERPPAPPLPEPQIKNIKLPEGVKMLLMPDQTLTYVVLPRVILTAEELAMLPQFLVALQQQINTLGLSFFAPVHKSNEIIELDKDESPEISDVAPNTETLSVSDSQSSKDDVTKSEDKEINMAVKEIVSESDDNIPEARLKAKEKADASISIDDNSSIAKENDGETAIYTVTNRNYPNNHSYRDQQDDDGEYVPEKELDHNAEQPINESSNKKSLLSDLMEMSGIMEEDLVPPQADILVPQEPIVLDTTHLVLQQQVLVPPPEPESQPTFTTVSMGTLGEVELVGITSFAQLRRATDNGALFFKLDLETGELTSINVCIQKFDHNETEKKSVIDLTDEPDVNITAGSSSATSTVEILPPKLKPLTRISHHSRKRLTPLILQKKERLMNKLYKNLKPANIPRSKMHVNRFLEGKQNLIPRLSYCSESKALEKIEANINLVDSDTPMEEEYLYDTDSSDDEPLILKAKRRRLDVPQNITNKDSETHNVSGNSGDNRKDNVDRLELESLTNQGNANAEKHLESRDDDLSRTGEYLDPQDANNLEALESEQLDAEDELLDTENELLNDDNDLSDSQGEILDSQDDILDSQDEHYDSEGEEHLDFQEEDSIASGPVPTNLLLSGGAFNSHNIPLHYTSKETDQEDDDCILGV